MRCSSTTRSLALVLFNPANRQEPLHGVDYWLEGAGLTAARSLAGPILVGARTRRRRSDPGAGRDRRLLPRSRHRRRATSAPAPSVANRAAGAGRASEGPCPLGGRCPPTVTTVDIQAGQGLRPPPEGRPRADRGPRANPADLRRRLQATDPDWEFSDTEMMTAVGHLANYGYVRVIQTSDRRDAYPPRPRDAEQPGRLLRAGGPPQPQGPRGARRGAHPQGGVSLSPSWQAWTEADRQIIASTRRRRSSSSTIPLLPRDPGSRPRT